MTEEQRQEWLTLAGAARDEALVGCIDAFSRTDFRNDLERLTVPTLVIHGDSDAIVPFEVSGKRTAESVDGAAARGRGGCPARLQRQPRGRVQPRPARVPGLTTRCVLVLG